MAFEVRMGSFAKKHNSTARPANLPTVMQCVLKEGFDLLTGEIGLDFGFQNSTPVPHNYAYIPIFRRYYFIESWEWRDRLWWAKLKVDVLGTYKESIGTQTCYVERAAAEYDEMIGDNLYPVKPAEDREFYEVSRPFYVTGFSGGSYVVGIIGKSNQLGSISYYVLTPEEMGTFRAMLMSSNASYFGTIDEISPELQKILFNPYQYVVSAMWFPFRISSGNSANIRLGWWTLEGVTGKQLTHPTHIEPTGTITIRAHPKAIQQGGGYRYMAPYSNYHVYIPPFGDIELPANVIGKIMQSRAAGYEYVTVDITYYVDMITGMCQMRIETETEYPALTDIILMTSEAQLGVPTAIAQMTGGTVNQLSQFVSEKLGASNTVSNLVGGAVSKLFGSISGDAKGFFEPSVQWKSQNGTVIQYESECYVYVAYHEIVDEDVAELGRPLCQSKRIDTLPGYIKTLNADVAITGASIPEQDEIKNYMDEGFFYE